jgi:hypothetical protein
MENFSGAQLSAFAPMRHTSRNPYLRIADIGADRFGPTLKGARPFHCAFRHAACRGSSPSSKNIRLPSSRLAAVSTGTESMRGSKTGCMPGASLHPRELSRAFERDGSYSLAEKRHANSGMRTLGPMPAFQTAQDEGRTRERIPSSSISTRKPTCNELAPCLVCARVSHK